jgi:hypothetical protein
MANNRCDDYCCNHGCNQGRACPARKRSGQEAALPIEYAGQEPEESGEAPALMERLVALTLAATFVYIAIDYTIDRWFS